MTKKNKDKWQIPVQKKKEKKKKIIEFVVIIQMRIHLDVTSLLNPISGIILKWNLFAQLFYRDDICMRYRGRFAKSQWNRAIRRERERDREHGKYTWVKSLFAPGPPSPQAFQLLLTINVRWKGRGCAFKALVHRRGIFAGNDSAVPPERVLMRSPLFAFQERIVKMIRLDPPPG